MLSPEQSAGLDPRILDKREALLFVQELLSVHPPRDHGEELILLGNFADITESGALSREEYCALYAQCAQQGDFADLALCYADFDERRYVQFLEDNPHLPETGDDLHPGRSNIEGALGWIRGCREGITHLRGRGERTQLSKIGFPSARLLPEWVIAVRDSGMRLAEICDLM